MLYGSDEPRLEFDTPRRAAVRFLERDPVLTIATIVTHSQEDLRESRTITAVNDTIHPVIPADYAGNAAFLTGQHPVLCDNGECWFSVIPAQAGIQIPAIPASPLRGNECSPDWKSPGSSCDISIKSFKDSFNGNRPQEMWRCPADMAEVSP